MEEKNPSQEVITAEQTASVIESIEKAVANSETTNSINFDKVKESISSLEGQTVSTVMGCISTALLLLPAGAIMAIQKTARHTFAAKAIAELAEMCRLKDSEEEPKETEETDD